MYVIKQSKNNPHKKDMQYGCIATARLPSLLFFSRWWKFLKCYLFFLRQNPSASRASFKTLGTEEIWKTESVIVWCVVLILPNNFYWSNILNNFSSNFTRSITLQHKNDNSPTCSFDDDDGGNIDNNSNQYVAYL